VDDALRVASADATSLSTESTLAGGAVARWSRRRSDPPRTSSMMM
jgi:hypothetical protein